MLISGSHAKTAFDEVEWKQSRSKQNAEQHAPGVRTFVE
jgi:hypothetical protein